MGSSCTACHSSCSTCDTADPEVCLTCPEEYFVDPNSNLCVECSISDCKSCESLTTCT